MSDQAFVDDDHGEGINIRLEEGKIAAPFDGVVIDMDFNGYYTIKLLSENGIFLKMKIISAVNVTIPNDIFHIFTEPARRVKKGDVLVSLDMQEFSKYADHIDVALIIMNSEDYLGIIPVSKGKVESGELLITTIVSEVL